MADEVLISWLGQNDIDACRGIGQQGFGSVGDLLLAAPRAFSRVCLLHNRMAGVDEYASWVRREYGIQVVMQEVSLLRPFDFDPVFDATRSALDALGEKIKKGERNISYLLSSGTKAMSTALLLVSCSDLPGRVFYNWVDPDEPDPRKRFAQSTWQDHYSLALANKNKLVGTDVDVLRGNDGRELSRNAQMKETYDLARVVACTSFPVLLFGETGAGKDLLANYIHSCSSVNSGPFVAINCGALPTSLIDSELFGHTKGAFTGADKERQGKILQANRGTLFLDEIGELPLDVQARLLRFLENSTFSKVGSEKEEKSRTRIIAATHRDLRKMIHEGEFRADLFFRLSGFALTLPPLRSRSEDFRLLGFQLLGQIQSDANLMFNSLNRPGIAGDSIL